jgi:hypothetical protein
MSCYYDLNWPKNLNAPLEYGFYGSMSEHFDELPLQETAALLAPFGAARSHHETANTLCQNTSTPLAEPSTVVPSIAGSSASLAHSPVEEGYPIPGGGWETHESYTMRLRAEEIVRNQDAARKAAAQAGYKPFKSRGKCSDSVDAMSNRGPVAPSARKARHEIKIYRKVSNKSQNQKKIKEPKAKTLASKISQPKSKASRKTTPSPISTREKSSRVRTPTPKATAKLLRITSSLPVSSPEGEQSIGTAASTAATQTNPNKSREQMSPLSLSKGSNEAADSPALSTPQNKIRDTLSSSSVPVPPVQLTKTVKLKVTPAKLAVVLSPASSTNKAPRFEAGRRKHSKGKEANPRRRDCWLCIHNSHS